MNEEEQEAIKDTEDILKELNKHKDKDFIGRLYYKNKPIENILQTLLNLIEKQQKEIEKLKSRKYILNAETNEIKEIPISDDYISKDKIKGKIKELENLKEQITTNECMLELSTSVEILKELLVSGQGSDQEGGQEDE